MAVFRSAQEADLTFETKSQRPEDLKVFRFGGSEGISELFQFDVDLVSEDGAISLASLVGEQALLTIHGEDGQRYVHGIISRFEQLLRGVHMTRYRARMVPLIWTLGHRYNSRIFQDASVPEIVEQVLGGAQVPKDRYRLSLQGSYGKREYCVQYRESDLAFISRLLEEEGISYFFEHKADSHVLVLADNPGAHVTIPGPSAIAFREPSGGVPSEECIFEFSLREEIRPDAVVLRDFNFRRPSMNLEVSASGSQGGSLEVYDYPGEYLDAEEGKRLAQVRLEELRACGVAGAGRSTCRRFVPGYRFTVRDHPRKDFNREYTLVRVLHTGSQPQSLGAEAAASDKPGYQSQLSSIPSDVPFRPPRRTPRPVVHGVQTALVVGPKGEEIYTDDDGHGRVKVQFHWDRKGEYNEESSCWVRVSQGLAGGQYGMMFLPRVGQEVIVDFLEGNPDLPIVVGRVYNGDHPPPYPLPAEKTKSTIKSKTEKGDGANEIRFEDKAGSEQVFIHAERNQDNRVKADSYESIGNERHLIVKKNQLESVEGDKHSTVQGDRFARVDGDQNLTVKGDQVTKVSGGNHLTVDGSQSEKVGGDQGLKAGGDLSQEAGRKVSIKAGTDLHEKAGMNYAVDAGMEVHIKGGMKVVVEAGMQLTLKAAGGFVDIGPAGVSIQGPMVMINSGGAAGVGTGSRPTPPAAPQLPDLPKMPGGAAPASRPPKAKTYGAQAKVLQQAAQNGAPFCEKCQQAAATSQATP